MGLGVSLISFSSGTTIFSESVNSNFTNLNAATNITITGSDAGVTCSGGAGALTCQANAVVLFGNGGGIGGIATFSGSASGTFNHGLTATPHYIGVDYAGNFGTPPTTVQYTKNLTATTVDIVAQAAYSWQGIAFRHN